MIETTSVEAPSERLSASRRLRETSAASARPPACRRAPTVFGRGLSRTPLAASAQISADGAASITTRRPGSSPCASQPVSIAPPILPAPASTMVPGMSCKALLLKGVTTTYAVVPANAGTHNHGGSSEAQAELQAFCRTRTSRGMGPGVKAGTTPEVRAALRLALGVEHRRTHGFRRRSCRPTPRTGTPDNSARRRGWRRPACSRIARSRR